MDTGVGEHSRLELMVRVARLYYEENLNQARIAQQLELSRPTVSRLLTEARSRKLVEIKIRYPWRSDPSLEAELIRAFPLKDARVLAAGELDDAETLAGVGVMGAQLVDIYLRDGMTLAISRGTGVYAAVQALHPQPQLRIRMVQMQGALGDRVAYGSDVAYLLISRFSGDFHALNAPLLLENSASTEMLMREPSIRDTLDLASRADVALVGIGSIEPEVSSLFRHHLMSREELADLARQEVVGDIGGRFFGGDGEEAEIELNHRLVSVSLEAIRRIPVVIGVASGLP
ncbi:MAG TPA: sugar-binding domain-containing protein, partial [Anaerolineaceae bacterium]